MVRLLIGRSFDADSVDVSRISSHFNLLCYFVIAVGCLLTAGSYFSYTVLPCCINTLCVIIFTFLYQQNIKSFRFRVGLVFSLGFSVLTYFKAVGQAVLAHNRLLYDQKLLSIDNYLLGFIFPQGQLSLWTDHNPWIGPLSFFGHLSTEILTLFYVSYYIWGVAVVLLLIFQLWKSHTTDEFQQLPHAIHPWTKLQMYLCSWCSVYMMNFLLNLTFPAVSPRIYLSDQYVNPLKGFYLADFLNNSVKEAAKGSFGAFPSGHVGVSWLVAISSRRFFARFSVFATHAAFMITCATLYLRYHYFVDVLAAFLLTFIGLEFGGFWSWESRLFSG